MILFISTWENTGLCLGHHIIPHVELLSEEAQEDSDQPGYSLSDTISDKLKSYRLW